MNLTGQATFIPKKPSVSIDPERKSVGFFSLIALIIFIGTLVGAGGVFFYKYTLEKDIVSLKNELEEQKAKFDPNFIKVMVKFNARIEVAKSILNKHVAVSSVFENLQRETLQSVQFQSFTFNGTSLAGKNTVKVNLKGIAAGYESLAAQSEVMNKSRYVKNPVFSSFNLNEQGRVNFVLDANLDAVLIDYRKRLSGDLFNLPALPSEEMILSTSTASTTIPRPTNSTSTNNLRP